MAAVKDHGRDWFRQIGSEGRALLEKNSSVLMLKNREVVYSPSPETDYVYVLLKGVVSIGEVDADGNQIILNLITKNQLFGELSVLSGQPRDTFAIALEPSRALRVPKSVFLQLVWGNRAVSEGMLRGFAYSLVRLQKRLHEIAYKSVRSRVASLLLVLVSDFGVAGAQGRTVEIRLTQTEISHMIGASRPSVNIALKEMEANGVISREGSRLTLLKLNALQLIAR